VKAILDLIDNAQFGAKDFLGTDKTSKTYSLRKYQFG